LIRDADAKDFKMEHASCARLGSDKLKRDLQNKWRQNASTLIE